MGVSNTYQLHGVNIDTIALTQTIGITQQTINTGTSVIRESSSRNIYPEVAILNARNPGATFSTNHMDTAINTFGNTGICIDSDASNPGVQMFAREQICSGPASGSAHTRFTFGKGIIVPRTLTVDHQQNCLLQYELFGVSGGGASGADAALIREINQAVATIVANTGRWTMATASVGGNTINSKQSIELDFGVVENIIGGDSDIEPSFATIQAFSPTITIRGVSVEDWNAIGLGGVTCDSTDTELVFRKRNTADATAQHIRVQINGLAYQQTAFDANLNESGSLDIVISGTENGAEAPLIWDTTYAIP